MNHELLRATRRDAGKTQEFMANALGYRDKSSYCQIENGSVQCSLEHSKRIKQVLGLSREKYFQIFLSE